MLGSIKVKKNRITEPRLPRFKRRDLPARRVLDQKMSATDLFITTGMVGASFELKQDMSVWSALVADENNKKMPALVLPVKLAIESALLQDELFWSTYEAAPPHGTREESPLQELEQGSGGRDDPREQDTLPLHPDDDGASVRQAAPSHISPRDLVDHTTVNLNELGNS